MLKIFGMVFVILGTAGWGYSLGFSLKRHLGQLLECRDIFMQMELEKKELRIPYGQMLRRSAKGKSQVFGEMLNQIADEMEENHEADVGIFWEKAFSQKSKELLFTEEEKEIFLSLARNLAMESSSTKTCEIYFFQLEKGIAQVMEEKKEKQKLYRVVGVLSGVLFVILLL